MAPVLEVSGVRKDYRGLRPLRVRDLVLSEGEIVAIAGPDAAAAEVLTNLVTGATLPDEGSIRVFGEDTRAIADADAWLAGLDRFGIVSDRVALLDGLTIRQNIAIAFTLDLDDLNDEVAAAVHSLADQAGLSDAVLNGAAGLAPPAVRLRTRVARAIALRPRLLLFEHPTGTLPRADVRAVAADVLNLIRTRGAAALVVSADRDFTRACDRELVFDAATGSLKRRRLGGWLA